MRVRVRGALNLLSRVRVRSAKFFYITDAAEVAGNAFNKNLVAVFSLGVFVKSSSWYSKQCC